MLRITNAALVDDSGSTTLRGEIGGTEAYFRFPRAYAPELRGEPFLAYALFLGMTGGQDIEIDPAAPVSPTLLGRLDTIQSLLCQWNPELRKISVSARAAEPARRFDGAISSYSGGVDSTYTFIQHQQEITHLLTLSGFDEGGGKQEFAPLVDRVQAFAQVFGKGLVPIETNARDVCQAFDLPWTYVHGPLLCCIGAGLGFPRYYIPASYTYRELKPWGSHPLLDPLWSNATTEVVHDGTASRRTEKTETITRHPEILPHLQVCWQSKTSNCGRCSKCARTLIVLDMLSVPTAPPFPAERAQNLISKLKVDSDLSASFVWDIMQMARARGQAEIEAALYRRLRRYMLRQHGAKLLKQLIGRRGQQIYYHFRKPDWRSMKIQLLDPDEFV